MAHDSYCCSKFKATRPFPIRRDGRNFLGMVTSWNDSVKSYDWNALKSVGHHTEFIGTIVDPLISVLWLQLRPSWRRLCWVVVLVVIWQTKLSCWLWVTEVTNKMLPFPVFVFTTWFSDSRTQFVFPIYKFFHLSPFIGWPNVERSENRVLPVSVNRNMVT